MPKLPIVDNFNVKLIPFADKSMTMDVCLLRCASHQKPPAGQSDWKFAKQSAASFKDQ